MCRNNGEDDIGLADIGQIACGLDVGVQGNARQGWTLIPNVGPDNPSSMYASRISTNAAVIQAIAVVPEPQSAILIVIAGFVAIRQRKR